MAMMTAMTTMMKMIDDYATTLRTGDLLIDFRYCIAHPHHYHPLPYHHLHPDDDEDDDDHHHDHLKEIDRMKRLTTGLTWGPIC